MTFELEFTDDAEEDLLGLEKDKSKEAQLKAVRKCLGYMQTNLRHPSLATHKHHKYTGPNGEELFQSYAQNNRPGAYRIFWYYSKDKEGTIIVTAILPHPD